MTTIILLAATIVGIVLLVLGLRGRRVDDHPVCRDCGFDLSGVYPASSTCPECGAGLRRPRGVRIGNRRRRWVLAGVGAALVLVLGAALPTGMTAFLSGRNVVAHLPLRVLLWEGRHAGPESSQIVADEVLNRLLAGTPTPTNYARIIDAALDIQGEPSDRWGDAWAKVLDRAKVDNAIRQDQQDRHNRQAAVVSVVARPRVRAGGRIPVVVTLTQARVMSSGMAHASLSLVSATLDGQELTRERPTAGPVGGFVPPSSKVFGWFQLAGSGSRLAMPASQGQTGGVELSLPPDASGRRSLRLSIAIDAKPINGTSWTWDNDPSPKSPTRRVVDVALPLEIVGDDGITLTPPTESARQRLESALRPSQVWAMSSSSWSGAATTVGVLVGPLDRATPAAFEVFARWDGRERAVGRVTSEPTANEVPQFWSPGGASTLQVPVDDALRRARSVDLIFRPSKEAAMDTIGLTSIYGGEIVVREVNLGPALDAPDPGPARGSPTRGPLGRLFDALGL